MAVNEETPGRLGQDPHSQREEDDKDDLESNGEPARNVRVNVRDSEVDPVSDEGTDGDHEGLLEDDLSSVVRPGALGDPRGDGKGVHSVLRGD